MPHFNQARQSGMETKIPSFSIVYETENLASVELENIYRSLGSIAAQDVSPEQANEFLIIDGGNAPPEVIEELCSKYSWITVRQAPGIGYYEAKMLGASLATGEIVVYCDSDCEYETNWLREILTTFWQRSDINIVAGETSTPVRNPYEFALALHYFFPRFSGKKQPYESTRYFLNAVAFRRDFLLQHPIPCDLPIYRGNCVVHAYSLCDLHGYKIWKVPQARSLHEPPTISFIFWRYLLMGRDRVVRKGLLNRLLEESQNSADTATSSAGLSQTFYKKIRLFASSLKWDIQQNSHKVIAVIKENPRLALCLPLVFPMVLGFELLFNIGRAITYFQPDLLLNLYKTGESNPTKSASQAMSVDSIAE